MKSERREEKKTPNSNIKHKTWNPKENLHINYQPFIFYLLLATCHLALPSRRVSVHIFAFGVLCDLVQALCTADTSSTAFYDIPNKSCSVTDINRQSRQNQNKKYFIRHMACGVAEFSYSIRLHQNYWFWNIWLYRIHAFHFHRVATKRLSCRFKHPGQFHYILALISFALNYILRWFDGAFLTLFQKR